MGLTDPGRVSPTDVVQLMVHELYTRVMSLPGSGPLYDAAVAVCVLRGTSPFDYVNGPNGGMQRWQAVTLEAALMSAMGRMVA